MTLEEFIIAVVRVLGSLPVLWWPFLGGIFAILVDLSDTFLRSYLDLGGVGDYHQFDKRLDQVYMLTFLVVALRWPPVPRNVAIALYAYRLLGFIVFEITDSREVLIFFPNLFELWFLFVAGIHFFNVDFQYTPGRIAAVLIPLLAFKLGQEYLLHISQWLDTFSAKEGVNAVWDWLTSPL